jgi:hypothetical protein
MQQSKTITFRKSYFLFLIFIFIFVVFPSSNLAQTLEGNNPLIKKIKPHATEIFHIMPAEPSRAQYIGSDLHFSCGFKANSFDWSNRHVKICLKNDYKK